MKTLFLLALMAVSLVGCNATVDINNNPPKKENPAAPGKGDTSTGGPEEGGGVVENEEPADDDDTVTLSVYTLTKVIASINTGGSVTTLTGSGSCVVIETDAFCWDDGTKTIPSLGVAVQYWGLDATLSRCPNTHGHCDSDLMSLPILMTANVIAVLDTAVGSAHRTVNEVFSSGVAANVQCTEADGLYDCGTFVVDTKQVRL